MRRFRMSVNSNHALDIPHLRVPRKTAARHGLAAMIERMARAVLGSEVRAWISTGANRVSRDPLAVARFV